jgi:hypothetical protein
MATKRVFPPTDGRTVTVVNGRTYSCPQGSYLDVPDFDADVLAANGWLAGSTHGTDVTAARPANPKKGATFSDTTLGYNIVFDGKNWRNPVTGAVV